jgi:hypothetical protein
MTRINILIAAGLALAVILPAVSAQAQSPRTFVSAAGSDSNPCSFAAPCRHFQAAVNATSAGGEVDALDPAGYGPIIISQAVTIEGQGWSYIAPPASGNAITIYAINGNVSLHGLSLNGAGITGGTNGIVFGSSGGSLTVTISDCVVQNFANTGSLNSGNGIQIVPTFNSLSFVITNTILSNNGNVGLYYLTLGGSATANGIIDHVVTTNNGTGISINTLNGGGAVTAAISNSVVSNNIDAGLNIINGPAPLQVSIDNASVSANLTGISASGSSKLLLGRSVVTNNSNFGVDNNTNTFFTYQNNQINFNGHSNQVNGNALVALTFQ